jgi:hypothetical protein
VIDPDVAAKLKTDDLVPSLIKCMNQLHNAMLEVSRKLDRHIEQDGGMLQEAFPNADLDGHRRYHEALIEALEARNRLVREILVKAGSAGMLAGIGWLGYAAWAWFKLEVHR